MRRKPDRIHTESKTDPREVIFTYVQLVRIVWDMDTYSYMYVRVHFEMYVHTPMYI